ncbi:MAG: DUF3501 family protein [Acidobacteria bacterium]|nr:DUF3501 family protein [Acidobacteriota bacterium]
MQTLDRSEIKNIAEYELERPQWRPKILEIKDRRRVQVGEHLIFLFENRETVRYQIQEMMRIERMVRPEDIEHEIQTYNELVPGAGELSATLLIAYPSEQERAVMLQKLLGLEQHIWLAVADTPPILARFDTRQIATDRISSVQYLKFRLSEEQVRRWREGARLIVDHPSYPAERVLQRAELEELLGDLA